MTSPPCSACDQPMNGQFVRALGTVFHLDCFRCRDCDTVVASKFFPVEGPDGQQYPLCERDYFRRLGLICGKCGMALRGSYITACSKKFHVEHFTCSVCPTLFGPQDSYYEHQGDVYCHFHYSTRFATKCVGCGSAILKQFVEINRNMRDECWHPECYMINKFWNVKVVTRRPGSTATITSGSQEALDPPWTELERQETATSLKEKQQRMEHQVYRIWTVLSAFEESSAACISDMLRHVSSGQYLDAIRMAEKFILHVEVLFAAIDDLEFHFARVHVKGMSHVREARMLCRKTVDLFMLLSHTQETSPRRMGMTQELLALVTGLAHYLKILIRIALTGALKLEREHSDREALVSFLDKLHCLASENNDPAARRVKPISQTPTPPNEQANGIDGTQGVRFGYRSLAPEYAGESPFWVGAREAHTTARPPPTAPPSDLCLLCTQTVEEDCVRLGTYNRWHSHCVKCKICGRLACPPPPPKEQPKAEGDEKETKVATARRPPPLVAEFLYELAQGGQNTDLVPLVQSVVPDAPPSAIFCIEHSHSGCRSGFEAVSRLEQYAFLLNVALRRLHLLLKKRGVIGPSSISPTPLTSDDDSDRSSQNTYRDSADSMRIKPVHLDRKLSATARLPKRSTIVESPTGKIALPTDVQHSPGKPSSSASAPLTSPSQTPSPLLNAPTARIPSPPHPQSVQPQLFPSQPQLRPPPQLQPQLQTQPGQNQTDLRLQLPQSAAPFDPTLESPSQSSQVIRPPFARNNTQVYIVSDTPPIPAESQSTLDDRSLSVVEEGLTLADIPQFIEREQQRSLPRQNTKPLISELSPLELVMLKHFAVLVLCRSSLRDQFDVDEILELVEIKKGGFWNKLFKGNDKKNLKKKGVFGVPLELLVEREGVDSTLGASRTTTVLVPSFIDDAISAMRQMDMSVEGIFRKNGNIRRLKDLTDAIDRDPASVDLTQDNAVQLAALLKKFLRDLPDPLLSFKLHRLWVATQSLPGEERRRLLHMLSIVLPKPNRDTLEVLFVFLKWVASFSHVDEKTGSKMDLQNLATVICPSILYAKGRDAARDESFMAIRVVTDLLEDQDYYFAVPDEFLPILEDQEYFAGSLELPSKEFLKKCEQYMRVKQGGRPGGIPGTPLSSVTPSSSGTSIRTEGSDARLLPHRSDPNIPRGRPPPDARPPVPGRSGHTRADSQSLERPTPLHANSDMSANHHTSPPKPGFAHQPFSHPGVPHSPSPRPGFAKQADPQWDMAQRPIPPGVANARQRPTSYARGPGDGQFSSPTNGRQSPAVGVYQQT